MEGNRRESKERGRKEGGRGEGGGERGGGGGGGKGGRAPEHYARALRCNTAGPFQICFLWACTCAALRLLPDKDM